MMLHGPGAPASGSATATSASERIAACRQRARALLPVIEARHAGQFDGSTLATLADELLAPPAGGGYHALPRHVQAAWQTTLGQAGEAAETAHRQATLLKLIERFDPADGALSYSDDVLARFGHSLARILDRVARDSGTRPPGDSLAKDIALCSHRLFPAGARVVEPGAVVQRSLLTSGGLRQALDFMRCLAGCGGRAPFLRVHTHLEELADFNPDGWRACCQRLADMLALNPGLRGVVGASWFYDPGVRTVSPHLAYVLDLPRQHGAHYFFAHDEGATSDALKTSATRREAFEQGRYTPRVFVVVWPRHHVMAWRRHGAGAA